MSTASSSTTVYLPQLSLLDKTIAFVSWALAGAIFLTVGWLAMEPDDPLGAVSLLTRSGTVGMLVQVIALVGVAAAMATVVAGRLLADVGTFAIAVGLAAVSLRGGTAEALLVDCADLSPGLHRWLAVKLACESVVWLVVILVAVGVSALVIHWCSSRVEDADGERTCLRAALAGALAAHDLPTIGGRAFGVSADQQTALSDGIKHAVITAGAGLAAIGVLSSGLSSRSIQHGQTCFVVTAGVCIASYIAYRIVPVRSALWSILGVGLIAVVAYLWASIRPAESGLPANIPSSHFLRVLPVQYISVGTAAAVAMFWYMYTPRCGTPSRGETAGTPPTRSPRGKPSRKGRQ